MNFAAIMRAAAAVGGVVLSCAAGAAAAQKPTNEDCLACHSDASLSKDVNGKPVSLHVDPDKFKNSMHRGMFSCADCHSDIYRAEHPPDLESVLEAEAAEPANPEKTIEASQNVETANEKVEPPEKRNES